MEFVEFFTQMHWAVIVLLVVCVALFVIEGVVPGFGIWGIMGIIAGVAAIICEAVFTQSLFAVFFMIFLILLLFTIIFVVFSVLLSKGVLKKTPLVETKTALPEDYKNAENLKQLVGKTGKVITICKPAGKAEIDGKVYSVRALDSNIYEGETIVVVAIKDNTILVKLNGGEDE